MSTEPCWPANKMQGEAKIVKPIRYPVEHFVLSGAPENER